MKHTTLNSTIILCLFVPLFLFGQKSAVNDLFDKYTGQEGFTSVDVSKGLFELFAEIEDDDPEFEDFQKAVKGIETLRLIAYSTEDGNVKSKEQFYDDVMGSIPFKDFKELMVIRDSDANVNFYAKSESSVISEMIMVVDGDDEAVLLSLTGNIDFSCALCPG